MYEKKIKIIFRIKAVLFVLFTLILLVFTFFDNDEKSYLLDLNLEKFSVVINKKTYFEIQKEFEVFVTVLNEEKDKTNNKVSEYIKIPIKDVSGIISAPPGSTVELMRVGRGDFHLTIFLENVSSHGEKIKIDDWDSDFESEGVESNKIDKITITVKNPEEYFNKGKHFVVPFEGYLPPIEKVNHKNGQRIPIIRSGSIFIVNKTIMFSNFYEIGPYRISPGDGLLLKNDDEKKEAIVNGFFTIDNEEPGLHLVANTAATEREISILRFNHEPLTVKVNGWQRVSNDDVLSLLWSTFIFLIPILLRL